MKKSYRLKILVLIIGALAVSCGQISCDGERNLDPAGAFANYERDPESEYPIGKYSNHLDSREAFSPPISGITLRQKLHFMGGNSLFQDPWVVAPASTTGRDGLGPIYNSSACAGCHRQDGRGFSPTPENPNLFQAMLVRISVPNGENFSKPDPIYGDQLEPFGIPGVPGEANQTTVWETVHGAYDDGEPYVLHKPTVILSDFNYGEPGGILYTSPRIAPQVAGLGFLEAIAIEDLLKKEDPDDKDGDGISGRLVRLKNDPNGKYGRFGWKAEQPTIEAQNAAAFNGDMGLTSRLHPNQPCTPAQVDCNNAYTPPDLEVDDKSLQKVTTYISFLSIPQRRNFNDPAVIRGERLFRGIGCSDCHTPSYITGDHPFSILSGVKIFPYTDLLVHDMGEDLSDGRPPFYEGAATAREWRTPPLWGVGLITRVNPNLKGKNRLLHDGRAQSVPEAILWHGGEAESARNRFKALSKEDRNALVSFVNSL